MLLSPIEYFYENQNISYAANLLVIGWTLSVLRHLECPTDTVRIIDVNKRFTFIYIDGPY